MTKWDDQIGRNLVIMSSSWSTTGHSVEDTIAVVPDLSSEPHHYFQVTGREQWASDFEFWLGSSYEFDNEWLLPGESCPKYG